MTGEDRMDKQFEAWFRKEYQLEDDDDINFSNGEVRMMLKGWRASREAVEVELPSVEGNGTLTRGVVIGVLGVVRSSIESQGLKVKP